MKSTILFIYLVFCGIVNNQMELTDCTTDEICMSVMRSLSGAGTDLHVNLL